MGRIKFSLAAVRDKDPIEAAEALIAQGKAQEAAQGLRARLQAGRGGLLARLTLIKALLAAGAVDDALTEAREALSLNPNVAPAVLGLGEALLAAELLPTAIAEFQRALRLDPGSARARGLLAAAWLKAGEADKALEALSELDDPPLEMLTTAKAIKSAPRSDPGYVRHLFDQFSADYDARMLGQLAYAAPQILADLAAMVMPGAGATLKNQLSILDLGCGTGLAGVAFKPLAPRLEGVDLSPAMIEKARARQIYDALEVADLEAALTAPGPAYDLILAADTLVYLGDLAKVVAAASLRLVADGFFLFTLESAAGEGFELGPKRRWRHSEAYVRAMAQQAGLRVAGLVVAAPRREAGQPVDGLAIALTHR
jgi:predicted TPR repeat methyltransferase